MLGSSQQQGTPLMTQISHLGTPSSFVNPAILSGATYINSPSNRSSSVIC